MSLFLGNEGFTATYMDAKSDATLEQEVKASRRSHLTLKAKIPDL